MYELALFSGAGGGILGGKLLGWRTIGAVEFEQYPREVLLRRQRDGMLPLFPIWDDVRTFRKDNPETGSYIEEVSGMAPLVISAGFPCQPYSVAGKGKGEDDERNLWPGTIRIIREMGPEVAFLENVPRLLAYDYFGEILGDLAEAGYDAEWDVVSVDGFGAQHLRERLWILAYSNGIGWDVSGIVSKDSMVRGGCDFGIPMFKRGMVQSESERLFRSIMGRPPASGIDGEIDGVADRMDRLRAIGNGQVAIVAAVAFCRLASAIGLDLRRYAPDLFGDNKEPEKETRSCWS